MKIDNIHTDCTDIANKLNNITPVIYVTLGLSVVSMFLQGLILYLRLSN